MMENRLQSEETNERIDFDVENHSQRSNWNICGTTMPKGEIVFFSQIIICYIIICTSIANLSYERGERNIWLCLLSSCLGYILPNPRLKVTK